MKKFLIQPINFSLLTQGQEHGKCDLHQSIAQRIHLVLVTNFGEFRSDKNFGCIIWEYDFENLPNINLWKDNMAKSIKEAIQKYEVRLYNQQVSIEMSQEEFTMQQKSSAMKKIKRRIDLKVNANIRKTNEEFIFRETLYISPVWVN